MKRSLILVAIVSFFLTLPLDAQEGGKMYQATTNSNIRAAPTTNSQKIGYLKEGSRVRVIGSAAGGNWHQVRLNSGQMGFVYGKLLESGDGDGALESGVPSLTGGPTEAPEAAFAYIIWPQNGEVIPGGDFVVLFGLHGMGTAPAGVDKEHTGHHHLLIDTDLPPLDQPIPASDNFIHFGRGQTEYHLVLPKGEHTLQLLLGDANHVPHTPPVMSERITVTVP
ncbi:DUF4399 domain-containing protein [Thiocapsa roseopersicina]|uniref:SH3 domain-containing protein n=1 Tax=Thiocapsa roseopersicina TaxID=1058 RepID=A0A1H2VRF9_THIRO|nr:DUF4399 domain-containing protein [Thiocapsa roseopersicina]SDW70871.1 SH3 domain-containing protein [Thiocapsa roseopersicina]